MKEGFILILLQCLALPYVHSMMWGDTHDQTPLDDPTNEQTYLRVVFSDGTEEFFRNWECPDGIWAEELNMKRQPNCVCVKGVYAIGSSLCEEDFKIITGNEHCFTVKDQPMRKFIPLIGKSGFAGRANTVFRGDGPYFARLQSSVPTTSVAEAMNYVFRMNDPYDFSAYAKLDDGRAARLKCFLAQTVADNPAEKPVMQIGRLPNCSNEFRGPKEFCDNFTFAEDYVATLQIGDSWSPSGEAGKGEVYPGSCANPKSKIQGRTMNTKKGGGAKGKVAKPKARGKRAAPPAKAAPASAKKKGAVKGKTAKVTAAGSDFIDSLPKCDKFDEENIEAPEFDTPASHFMQIERIDSSSVPKFHSASIHQKDVSKQNKRIAHQLRKFFMNGTASPKFLAPFQEYKYVTTAKEITKKVCPEEFLPKQALDLITGVFRLLYLDSSKSFPYPLPFKEAEHTRIMNVLTKCKEGAQPMSFVPGTNESCSDNRDLLANQTYNATTFILFDPKYNLSIPGHASFNFSSVDVALELVWKMTLLTHYYCAPKFEENPLDLSQFYVKVEAMFLNPMMQFRWYFPGQFNRLMQYFLMAYDLIKIAKGIDRCVAAAYGGDNYPGWMSRPADLLGYDGGRTKYLSHEVGRSFNGAIINLERSKRKKRFYMQDDMWKRQAYCMHTTDAPFVEVRTSTYPTCKKKPAWFENID